ncbi:MAG TPA: DUF2197 domain-containing protein [Syntrophomonadaceae bacterium]|nr:DUF2197 domain-containing protein [Syntrophomonadaceae bacterium]HOQ09829.1 DUF2197 domain-containing protein [Syntrophomonadaceae bacterium]HPU48849.1 DUF2197 domain-containing protein [Syntrophomonadaceae bacterium]HQA07603.1 DUF2197 domain-containing protein [Syntrophomonadaceae bacterium]HQD90035.1 DUF2197 domain-containing protein [Syntrophomonadaceae bacterium]
MKGESITARCLMCGKTYDVPSDHKEYPKLAASKSSAPAFICDLCEYRVRHEADEQQKPKKPM